ncbi:MAG: glycosyltransferase family 39 protein [Polyangiaceae bacterium]
MADPPEVALTRPGLGRGEGSVWALFAVAVAVGTTLGGIGLSGIWDPPELQNAEFARRIAHDWLGASELGGPRAEPVITREILGRGELPFFSIALGFRLFGLSTWAGRLPLALWALAGAAALYFGVRRLHSARAAALSVLALCSMPLYFVAARTLLGDVVTMAANAAATMGLCVAVFDQRGGRMRSAALGLALLGLAGGFSSRGLALGVGAPALGVGLAWLALRFASERGARFTDWVGGGALVLGAASAVVGTLVLLRTPDEVFSIWLGATPGPVSPRPSFDLVLRELGHGLFPWSALLLPAFGRTLFEPRHDADLAGQGLSLALCTSALCAVVTQTLQATLFGVQAFAAPATLAAVCALSLHDWDQSGKPSRWFGLSVAALLLLLLIDFRNFPEKGLVPFALGDAVFPARFARPGFAWLAAVSVPLSLALLLLVQEAPTPLAAWPARRRAYKRWPRFLRRSWRGAAWFGLLSLGSACALFELMLLLSDRLLHAPAFEEMSQLSRTLVSVGWLAALGVLLGPLLALLVRDALRAAVALPLRFGARYGLPLGACALCAFALGGSVLGFGYYVSLARELSPKQAFDTFRRTAPKDARLGLLGVGAAAARYQAGTRAEPLRDADEAAAFLLEPGTPRYVALRVNELAGVNAVFRKLAAVRRNVSVFDSRSSEVLLVSKELPPGVADDNPFSRWVSSTPPSPRHPLDVDLGGKLSVLGWDVVDSSGDSLSAIAAGVDYEFCIYYRVEQRVAGNWDTFLHIDGMRRRFNGDHPTLGGHYPFALWLVGDVMVDRYSFRLGPEFSPGSYRVYFGLYSGSRRLEVRRGAHQDDRIEAGSITVK